MSDQQTKLLPKAEVIIKRHVLFAAGAGFIPIPLLDIFAVTSVQMDMIKQLCKLYGHDYKDTSGKALVSTLTGTTLSRIAAGRTRYALKAIPLIGPIIGGVTVSAFSGATTYAIGQVLSQHFASGGSATNFDEEKVKDFFEEQYKKGKDVVKEWVEEATVDTSKKTTPEKTAPSIKEQLKHLEELKKLGFVTKTEYKRIKKRLEKNS